METTATDNIGSRIDAVRSTNGMTLVELSTAAQIPLATLHRRLAGDGRLTVPELNRISSALAVPVASWFEVAA